MTPWTGARQASLSFTISWSLLKLTSIESVMLSNHLILCHSLLFLPLIFPSIRVFSSELALRIRWPKYRSFNFSISSSSKYLRLISLKIHVSIFPQTPPHPGCHITLSRVACTIQCVGVCVCRLVVSNSLRPHGLQPARLLCPWNSPGKNTGVGCHSFLQEIFPAQGSNSDLLNCRQILYPLSYQRNPVQ